MVNSSWKDLDTHGRRLVKIIKILESKMSKVPKDDIDGLSRLAATIGNITKHTIELIKLADNYEEILGWFNALKQDKKTENKQIIRDMDKGTPDNFEEEKSVRQQMKKKGKERL